MDVIIKVLSEQWIFIVLSLVILGVTFLVKKIKPEVYTTYCKAALIITTALLIVLAVLFSLPDLFLLIPIIIICCELFGYTITGKVVAVLFVDFMLIQLIYFLRNNNSINDMAMNIIFVILQVITAVVVGFIMDKYIRTLQQQKISENDAKDDDKAEMLESSEEKNGIDSLDFDYSKYSDDVSDESENSVDDLDNQIDDIIKEVKEEK